MFNKKSKKDGDYFGYFAISSGYAVKAASYLHESLGNFDPNGFFEKTDVMHEIEHAADANNHEMVKNLVREFITPIEREDIIALSQQLDNVVDSIDDIMRKVYMFDIQSIRPGVLEFTALIIRCCEALHAAASEFRNFHTSKTLGDRLIDVNTIESDGDALHAKFMRDLFYEKADARETLIWMQVYDGLEACLDACEDAADIIESVIMKNN